MAANGTRRPTGYAGPMACGDAASTGTCLIVGCGYVGVRLARRLKAQGPVLALTRTPAHAEELAAAGIPARPLDLDDPGPFEVSGDLSAAIYLVPPDPQGQGDGRLQRFLEGLPRRPGVLVYFSSTGVYGSTGTVDESSPTAPADGASRRRLAAEELAAAWCAARGIRFVALRVPGIYGPHRLPLDRLQAGEPVLRPEDAGPGNRIHVDDLVDICLAALARPVSGAVNVADGDHRSIGAFLELVARLAGLPAPRRVALAEARQAISPGMLAYLLTSRKVLAPRLRKDLGLDLRYADPEAGVRASLGEMGLMCGNP